jgi:hypothetical protein
MTTFFNDLTIRFPTSEALLAWLRSDEGGRLHVREQWATPDSPLALIHYDKETSDMTVPHVGLFRSVVWNTNTNRPVCIAPARGLAFSKAVEESVDPAGVATVVEDFVDGVMLNMFYDGVRWRLATRTVLDAECTFYGSRSFAHLFWETFDATGLDITRDLTTDATYSWVLQHPEERIVVSPTYGIPKLYLVSATGGALSERLQALIPQKHTLATLEDVKERVAAWGKRFGPQWQGVVLKTPDGRRFKLRSNEYDEARHLRGNQAKRAFVWLERWGQGRLPAYLRLFPEEEHEATSVVERFKAATKEAHETYLKVYRRHELPLGQAPQKFRKLLWEAHQAGKGAYFPTFRQFMNDQDTARKLWLVNWDLRYGAAAAGIEAADPAA